MRISKHDTNLRGCCALFGQFTYLVDDLFGGGFEPGGWGAGVRNGAGRDAFAIRVKSTHGDTERRKWRWASCESVGLLSMEVCGVERGCS